MGGEVLVITGRGRGSAGGQPVVRPAVLRRLARLRRQGVVTGEREHTAGSFIVTLAPLADLLSAGRRAKDPPPRAADTDAVNGLAPATARALRDLAVRSLELLGAPRTDALVAHEMAHQFSRLAAAAGAGRDREIRLRAAIASAQRELEDRQG